MDEGIGEAEQKLRLVRAVASIEGADVLDIGCGDGSASLQLAEHAATVLGVDPDREAIATARKATPDGSRRRVWFLTADVLTVRLPEAAFDVAIFMRSL